MKICRLLLIAGIALSFVVFKQKPLHASEVDILVQKLVEKGVLTPGEAQQIMTETKEEVRKEVAAAKSVSSPEWAQRIKFKGDVRTRFQWENRKGKPPTGVTKERQRARIRLRAGVEAKVTDKANVAFGLASGDSSDARSTNQTLTGNFSKKAIWIDYAYAQYAPFNWLTVTGGRIKNPMYQTGDSYWDTDINPDGAAAQFEYKPPEFQKHNLALFANVPLFLIEENDDSTYTYNDPFMWGLQPGLSANITDRLKFKGSFNYYDFVNTKDKSRFTGYSTRGCNTFTSTNTYMYDYNIIGGSAELGMSDPFGTKPIIGWLPYTYIPYIGAFGDSMHNTDPPTDRDGWEFGGKLGYEKVGKKGEWQISANYRRLEPNTWLDCYPDSDFYGGATGVKGLEFIYQYALIDNVTLGFDYYHSEYIKGYKNISDSNGAKRPEDLYQVDLVFKF